MMMLAEIATVRRRLGAKMGWTLGDQLVASATNAGLSILVARSVTEAEFGAFAIAFVVYAFSVGLIRSVVTDPLIIHYSTAAPDELRTAAGKAAGASAAFGLVASAICLVASTMTTGATRLTLFALAFVLPALLVQDAWRRAFFAAGRPKSAFANDSLWAVLQLGGAVTLTLLGRAQVEPLVLTWGAAAGVAAVYGMWQTRARPRPWEGLKWVWTHRDLGSRFGLDFLISQGAFNMSMALIAVVGGLAATGALRAGQVLLGPIQVLGLAITSFAMPVLAARKSNPGEQRRIALLLSAGATFCTIAWVAALLLLPDSVGHQLMGASWPGARQVLPLLGIQVILIGIVTGATVSLKALGQAGMLLRLTMVQAPVLVVGAVVGAYYWGAMGGATGFVLAHAVGTVLGWLYLARVTQVEDRVAPMVESARE